MLKRAVRVEGNGDAAENLVSPAKHLDPRLLPAFDARGAFVGYLALGDAGWTKGRRPLYPLLSTLCEIATGGHHQRHFVSSFSYAVLPRWIGGGQG